MFILEMPRTKRRNIGTIIILLALLLFYFLITSQKTITQLQENVEKAPPSAFTPLAIGYMTPIAYITSFIGILSGILLLITSRHDNTTTNK